MYVVQEITLHIELYVAKLCDSRIEWKYCEINADKRCISKAKYPKFMQKTEMKHKNGPNQKFQFSHRINI